MRFNDWLEAELLKSEYPSTLSKYVDDFRDYYKEAMHQTLLCYYGGRYISPEFHLTGFEEEAKSCAKHAVAYTMKGVY
tara:strand:- start:324 stop:557 length:234 start_codon:yes stop_codon:yes gene_type:complete